MTIRSFSANRAQRYQRSTVESSSVDTAFGMESAYCRSRQGPVAGQAQPFEQTEAVVHGTF